MSACGTVRAAILARAGKAAIGLLALAAAGWPADSGAGEAPLSRLEAKWGAAMRQLKGWDDASIAQFREGYRRYPADVLERALAAETFDGMRAALDVHAAEIARARAMKTFPMGRIRPGDADDPRVVQAHRLAAKSLGEDMRDLVFVPITPCTVWDTRFASGAPFAGAIGDGVTRRFYSHLDGAGGSYAPYGGNPSCPETAQDAIGGRPYAVMMTVYVNDPVRNGWLTFYRDGDADPSTATISVYYSPGPTRTQTVIAKSSRGYGTGAYDVAVTGRYGSAHASASVTGYFLKPQATAPYCFPTFAVDHTLTPFPDGTDFSITDYPVACPSGFTRVAIRCAAPMAGRNVPLQSNSSVPTQAVCRWRNMSGSSAWQENYLEQAVCCQVPGR